MVDTDTKRKSKINLVLEDLAELVIEKRAVWRCRTCRKYEIEYFPSTDSYEDIRDRMMNHYREFHDFELFLMKGARGADII